MAREAARDERGIGQRDSGARENLLSIGQVLARLSPESDVEAGGKAKLWFDAAKL